MVIKLNIRSLDVHTQFLFYVLNNKKKKSSIFLVISNWVSPSSIILNPFLPFFPYPTATEGYLGNFTLPTGTENFGAGSAKIRNHPKLGDSALLSEGPNHRPDSPSLIPIFSPVPRDGENTRQRQSSAALFRGCKDQPLENLRQHHFHPQSLLQVRVWYCDSTLSCSEPQFNFRSLNSLPTCMSQIESLEKIAGRRKYTRPELRT